MKLKVSNMPTLPIAIIYSLVKIHVASCGNIQNVRHNKPRDSEGCGLHLYPRKAKWNFTI